MQHHLRISIAELNEELDLTIDWRKGTDLT